jgi:type I restriction enzyme S subunit
VLRHAATQEWFDVLCNRSTIAHFTVEKFGEMWTWLPDAPKQRAIADYLDRETARLDALVAAKERVLGLLTEKRRALITCAVTRGLDPRAPLRDSGIPWLGEIPAHWETERTRWLFNERDQRSPTGEEELLTVSHLTGVTPRSEKDVNMFEADTTEGYKICLSGDLVINTLWAWMGAMGVSPIDGIASPAYNVYEPRDRLEPGYIDALVRLPVFAQEVARYSKGVWSSRLRLYPEGFFEVLLPVPSLSEQRTIVAHIAKETAKLDELRIATERTTVLLKERRAALIAAAVTGQVDVESAA